MNKVQKNSMYGKIGMDTVSAYFKWDIYYQHILCVEKEGITLCCTVSSNNVGGFLALAVQTAEPDIQTLFNNHAHLLIGDAFSSIEEAKRASEEYACNWMKGEIEVKKCECEEIE